MTRSTVDPGEGATDAPVQLDRQLGVLVVRPLGRLDAGTIEHVVRIVAEEPSQAVIVDLDRCFVADPEALASIDATTLAGVEVCIVSSRTSCRRLLVRAGVTARFPVFQRRGDALQARLLAADGYGPGWTMSTDELRWPTVADPVLHSETAVTGTPEGRLAATIELHGELCASTSPQLDDEIRRLIDDGADDLVIDLTELRLCTSHGLDIFDRAHQHLRDHRDGAVRLQNAHGVVDRVLTIVEDADPTFPALRQPG